MDLGMRSLLMDGERRARLVLKNLTVPGADRAFSAENPTREGVQPKRRPAGTATRAAPLPAWRRRAGSAIPNP